MQGLGTQKISERTGVSKTSCTRIRNRLIARLAKGCRQIDGDSLEVTRERQTGAVIRQHQARLVVELAAQRAREISGGAELTIDRDRDKNPVVALREIAEETVLPDELHDSLIGSLQKVQIDDDDTPDEIGSIAQSAEALRLTAAAPPRNQNIGGDYDG